MLKEDFTRSTIINDPSISPYFIGKDQYCYTIYETIDPKTSKTAKKNKYIKPVGHFTNLGNVLTKIASLKMGDGEVYDNIQNYISSYEKTIKNIQESLKTTNI